MARALRNFRTLGLIGIGAALCGSAMAQEDYSHFRVLETKVIEEMMAGPANTAALLSPDGRRVLHLETSRICLLATSQIGPWTTIGCAENSKDIRPGLAEDMFWSPAGDRLLMPTFTDGLQAFRDTDIRLFDPATFTVTNLTDDGFADGLMDGKGPADFDTAARWLDSDTIAFTRYAIPAEGLAGMGPPRLMTIEAGGGEAQVLAEITANRLAVYSMAVSPDGGAVAYSIDDPKDEAQSGIYLLRVEDATTKRLASLTDIGRPPRGLAFSADGKYLLLLGPDEAGNGVDARVLDLGSGKVVRVDPDQNVAGVAWSPTGSALAYITWDQTKPDAPGGLFLAEAPGMPGRLLVGGAFMPPVCCGNQPFTWAANDTMILGRVNEMSTVLFVRLGK